MNLRLIRFLRIANKLSIKFHLGRTIGNLLFGIFNTKKSSKWTKGDSNSFLDSLHKDVESSALCENEVVEPTVDLQIIVPVYKVEKYLDGCLQSILNQKTDYTFKVVAVNDGSPDRSGEILEKYRDDDRVIVISQENRGLSGARNTGLRTIFGKYVGFLDSDDELAPGAIQAWLDAAYKNDADIVDGSFRRMTTDGELRGGFVHTSDKSNSGFVWTRIYKPYLFQNVYFPERYWFEDSVIGLIMPHAGKYVAIKDYVYHYRVNPASIMHTFNGNPKSLDALYITRSLMKDASTLDYIDFNSDWTIDFFLRQFQYDWHRTHTLGEEVEDAVFDVTKKLLLQYFPEKHTSSKQFMNLEKSLRNNDFNLYRRECCYM